MHNGAFELAPWQTGHPLLLLLAVAEAVGREPSCSRPSLMRTCVRSWSSASSSHDSSCLRGWGTGGRRWPGRAGLGPRRGRGGGGGGGAPPPRRSGVGGGGGWGGGGRGGPRRGR